MSSEIRLWKIENDSPKLIEQSTLDLEARLEQWLRQGIGMINDDLLAIDSVGNLVVLELKKDRTPRSACLSALVVHYDSAVHTHLVIGSVLV